jgi:hypothetical protein
LTIPVGANLISCDVTASDAVGDIHYIYWQWNDGPNSSGGDFISFLSVDSPGSAAASAVPLGAGAYHLYSVGFTYDATPATADYTFTFVLQPVPEPASAPLLILAAPLMLYLWRQTRAKGRSPHTPI